MSKNSDKILAQYIIEVRTQPQMSFVDHKGQIADTLSKFTNFKFTYWSVSENRVDLMSEDNKTKPFVSFMNYGIAFDNITPSQIVKVVTDYFNELFNKTDLFKREVVRIGVRSNFVIDKGYSFEDVRTKYENNFFSLKQEAIEAIGGELIDIGAPFNFRVSDNKGFNTNSGPMKKLQMRDFFQNKRTFPDGVFPENGLYFDIDYFCLNLGKVNKTNLVNTISENIGKSVEIFTNFTNQIFQ